jgi:transposase
LPATYTRPHGVRHFLAFYDVGRDALWGRFYPRKRWQEVLDALKTLRRRYPPDEIIYLVLDNFSPHKRKEVLRWAKLNKVKLVWTPTNASWLNRIECQFTEFRKFVFHNTYYKTHSAVKKAAFKFLRYRNHRQKQRLKTKHRNLKQHKKIY